MRPDSPLSRDSLCESDTGRLTAAQETWLGVLGGIPSCEVHVCRPVDWLNGDVERWLR